MILIFKFETAYQKFLVSAFWILNPFKKIIIKTECQVHVHINQHALTILKNDRHMAEYRFFSNALNEINKGAIWADQDFKSSNHFYHPYKKKRGLYGRSNALDFAVDYYANAVRCWNSRDFDKSFFYLGASLHLVQDVTIPQHVNIRLMEDHRQFENFVKRTHQNIRVFQAKQGAYVLSTIENYVKFNARTALKIYKRFRNINNDEIRYYRITKCTLPLAERTTAGAMLMFYNKVADQ